VTKGGQGRESVLPGHGHAQCIAATPPGTRTGTRTGTSKQRKAAAGAGGLEGDLAFA